MPALAVEAAMQAPAVEVAMPAPAVEAEMPALAVEAVMPGPKSMDKRTKHYKHIVTAREQKLKSIKSFFTPK
jgi:ABC-type phosphate/phosphonate transport system substrate-binding protein